MIVVRFTVSEVAADWLELMLYRGALCGDPLPAIANSCTRSAAPSQINHAKLQRRDVARNLVWGGI